MLKAARQQRDSRAHQLNFLAPVVAISACVILLWGLHLKDSIMPNTDFYGFYSVAQAIRDLETPENFKRAPLYTVMLIPLASAETPSPSAILLGRILSLGGIFCWVWRFMRSCVG